MNPSILQTHLWENFQKDLNEPTFYLEGDGYVALCIKKSTPAGSYLYLPYGPYLRDKNASHAALEAVLALAEREHAICVRIEPQSAEIASEWLEMPNCRKSHDLNPADTWVLSLTPDEKEIISGFSQGTRTRYNNFAKKGLSVSVSKDPADLRHLVRMQAEIAKYKKISVFSEEYYRTELAQPFASLYLVQYTPSESESSKSVASSAEALSPIEQSRKGVEVGDSGRKVIAASLFFDDNETRYYMQSAADYAYRKLPATVALLTTSLFDAKKKGLKNFDFWGIAPDGAPANHPWAGFTDFKKSFGGHPVHYAGTHDLILSPAKYKSYQLLRKANRLRRKLKS